MKEYQSAEVKELFAALCKAQSEIKHADKKESNSFFKSKYADLPLCFDASRPALVKHGLSVIQISDFDEANNLFLITQLNHTSGQWIRGYYPVISTKQDPQSIGSAITYARRYAYNALVGVAAIDEDDDGNAASGNKSPTMASDHFDKHKKKWNELVVSGQKTPEQIIAALTTKHALTEEQQREIKSWAKSAN